MGDFFKLGLTHILVGYEANVLGTLISGGDSPAKALLIIAFICYTVATILAVLQQLGDLKGNFPAQVSTIVLILLAALLSIIGVAIWGSRRGGGSIWPYSGTLDCTSALMAIIAGVFFILCLTGAGGGGGGGSRTSPQK